MSGAVDRSGSIAHLLGDYRRHARTPADVIDEVYARIAARGNDHVWITLVPQDQARARAAALDPADLESQPLFGIPYALKDNIDAAGLPTTAACPGFAREAEHDAALVARLHAAGAILIGKTNLDQFATGLNGTRSPYGAPTSVVDPSYISGGSSSGSAVAVAAGLVPFAIGTDTAGSGRVPAALNGLVGYKPSIGLISATGMLAACRSLDCASVFALDVADASRVAAVLAGFDPSDPWSRRLPAPPPTPEVVGTDRLRLAVPAATAGWGGLGEKAAWDRALHTLAAAGVDLVPVELGDLLDAGEELYGGAWAAERLAGLDDFVAAHPEQVHPVTLELLRNGQAIDGIDVFAALSRMQGRRQQVRELLSSVDALLTPTVTRTFTIEDMLADPVTRNAQLGTYTTFTNLLDLCAVAVPAGEGSRRMPFGVTVQAPAGSDGRLLGIAAALETVLAGHTAPTPPRTDTLEMAVVGAHLAGMPLHGDLSRRGAELVERTTTSASYRLFALHGTTPAKPGLLHVEDDGRPIEVEVYRLRLTDVGSFLRTVNAPLAIGEVELASGRRVHGFVCEPIGLADAEDITSFGGWRAYCASHS